MEAQAMVLVLRYFGEVEDDRRENARHRLIDILAVAMLAIMAGADDYEAIVDYGQDNEDWLKGFLTLRHGIPSCSTFRRVFARLKPRQLQRALEQWSSDLAGCCAGKQIAIDGKTLRRSFDHAWKKLGVHVVTAWCVEEQVVLGQVAVEQKSNEITALPQLLGMLDLEEVVVTADAMHCQRDTVKKIMQGKGHYVLAVKENQAGLYEQVKGLLDEAKLEDFEGLEHDQDDQYQRSHGREERRKVYCSEQLTQWVRQKGQWAGLRTLILVERWRKTVQKQQSERHYYISDLGAEDAGRLAQIIRRHWSIENQQHWSLDMAFREDECRVRVDHGAENLAVMRRLALSLLRRDTTVRLGAKNKRLKAGRNPNYLLKLITQTSGSK